MVVFLYLGVIMCMYFSELTMMCLSEPSLMQVLDYQNKGVPIGRAPEVNLRNNHAQYIFTW